jgi:transcriptional regulator with XRE-family HTH domain
MNRSDSGEAVSIQVGEAIRGIRHARRMTLRGLARASSLSPNALSMIERGQSSPSVSTLYRVAEALAIPISRLFRVEEKRLPVVFCRSAERTRLPIPHGLWEGLGGESFDGPVQPMVLTLETGGNSGPSALAHAGHEFVYCLRGQLMYQVDDSSFLLEPGDSLLFRAYRVHRWRNPGRTVTEALLLLSGLGEDDRPAETHGGGQPLAEIPATSTT